MRNKYVVLGGLLANYIWDILGYNSKLSTSECYSSFKVKFSEVVLKNGMEIDIETWVTSVLILKLGIEEEIDGLLIFIRVQKYPFFIL